MKTKASRLRPPVKTHGGKWYLTDFVINNFPENYQELTYVEPFCAGASVFLNKTPSSQEVINDIDGGVISIFRALRDEADHFIETLSNLEYTEEVFLEAQTRAEAAFEDYVELAVNEYTLRRMSRGGMKKNFAWSDRQRGGKPGDVNAWETMLLELPKIAERIKDAIILNLDYLEVMRVWDEEKTLTYLDPPYMQVARAAKNVYDHELTEANHVAMLNMAKNARGKVAISGYACPLYARTLKDWRCKKKNVANHSSQGKTKQRRVEVLWMNY